jgi:hypothetical protein
MTRRVVGGDDQKGAESRVVTARRSISGDDQKDAGSGAVMAKRSINEVVTTRRAIGGDEGGKIVAYGFYMAGWAKAQMQPITHGSYPLAYSRTVTSSVIV